MNKFFLSNPFYRGMVEKILLVGMGICGQALSWKSFSLFPWSNIAGGLLALLAYAFHCRTERHHRQAHEESQNIEIIVTSGVYSRVRHPLYLSLIAMNVGIGLAFGVMITFILSMVTVVHWVVTALKEEQALMEKFPAQYSEYSKRVRWLMIPGVF
jgi:protein-S-isoprenylcysteine O-methyltransferase Ste14